MRPRHRARRQGRSVIVQFLVSRPTPGNSTGMFLLLFKVMGLLVVVGGGVRRPWCCEVERERGITGKGGLALSALTDGPGAGRCTVSSGHWLQCAGAPAGRGVPAPVAVPLGGTLPALTWQLESS